MSRHTLYVSPPTRDVTVYQVPPSSGRGHRAADWRTDAQLFRGRLRVEAVGDDAELRLEDAASGDLFAVAPVPHGARSAAVEPAIDSSRNFGVRLVDAASGRAVIVGLSFSERNDAFDFNVALTDHETRVQRARDAAAAAAAPAATPAPAAAPGPTAPSSSSSSAFSLKEGQSITVPLAAKKATAGGGLLSRAGGAGGGAAAGAAAFGLPPPPVDPFAPSAGAPAPAPAPSPPLAQDTAAVDPFAPPPPAQGGGGADGGAGGGGWATFD